MEGRVRERDEALDRRDVVVGFRGERGLAEARVGLVVPLEDAGAREVDVVDGVVGFGYAFGDGFGGGDVVGGFGGVFGRGGLVGGGGWGWMGGVTEDDVGFAGFFFEDGLVGLGVGAVDDLDLVGVGIRGPDGLHAVFIAHGEGVLVLGVGVVQDVKGIAADVSWSICELWSWTMNQGILSHGSSSW